MASLPDHSTAVAEEKRRWSLLDDFAREWGRDPLLWALLPKLVVSITGADVERDAPRLFAAARNGARALRRRYGPTLIRVGSVVFVSSSTQTLRVLEPIAHALEARWGQRVVVHLPTIAPSRLMREHRRGSRLVDALRSHLVSNGCELPPGVSEEVVQTAIFLARSEEFMAAAAPGLLVVGTQHNSATRAVLAAAYDVRESRTAYVPHAPVTRNPVYRDLPTHYALLRGPSEAAFYDSIGAPMDQLSIVGDPSIPVWPEMAASTDAPVVFAASPNPMRVLASVIGVIDDARFGRVEVAPHPRMPVDPLRAICPTTWGFNPVGSTFERLMTNGAASLVQHGSGTGLEALALGLPVVDLCHPGREPNYPYLVEPLVAVVSNSDDLRDVVQNADRTTAAADHRRDYARTWCCRVGAEAISSACDMIERILVWPCPARLARDAWSDTLTL